MSEKTPWKQNEKCDAKLIDFYSFEAKMVYFCFASKRK
jgi:hypothetical protein